MIGSESVPALPRSSSYAVATPFSALASPNSPIEKSGWASCAAATASRTGSILSTASSLAPRIVNSTSAERPSSEMWSALPGVSGERTSLDDRRASRSPRRRPRPRRRRRVCLREPNGSGSGRARRPAARSRPRESDPCGRTRRGRRRCRCSSFRPCHRARRRRGRRPASRTSRSSSGSRSSDPFGLQGCDRCVWCGTCSFLPP